MRFADTFRLARKNLFRYWRRTIITASALAIGIACFILLDSLLKGGEQDSERNLIKYETASGRLVAPGYWDRRNLSPIDAAIDNPDRILALMDQRKTAATPRIIFRGELITRRNPYPEDGALSTRIFAIDPERDNNVYQIADSIIAGRYLEPGELGVLIGGWLAEDLTGLRVDDGGIEEAIGYPLTILTRTRDGYRQIIDATIVGVFNCDNPIVNRTGIFMPIDTADTYLGMKGAVTGIDFLFDGDTVAITLEDTVINMLDRVGIAVASRFDRQVDGLDAALADQAIDADIRTRYDIAESYYQLAGTKTQGSGIFILLIFIIAAVGISNTMIMSTYERKGEIGMMRALGAPMGAIRGMFLLEAAGIGLLGASFGIALGCFVNIFSVRYGIDYSSLLREVDVGYRISNRFKGAWDAGSIINAGISGVVLCVLVSIFPIRRALKRSIPECFR